MNRTIATVSTLMALMASGCAEIDKLKEDIEKITNQTVLSGLVVGSEPLEHPLIDADAMDVTLNESRIFLASAGVDSTDLNPSAITGAEVIFESDTNGSLVYNEDADGFYSLGNDDGLEYVDDEMVSVVFEDEAGTHSISSILPAGAEFDLPDDHATGRDVTIDLSNQGFDSYLVAVTRFPEGEIVYSNEPQTFEEIYNLSHPETELTSVVIPGDSFSEDGVYAIALSALVTADTDSMVELNTVLSSLMTGKVAYDVICVPDWLTVATPEQ